MVLVVPSSVGVETMLLQFTDPMPLVFCCNRKPVEGDGQKTATVFVVVRAMESNGAPGSLHRRDDSPETAINGVTAAAHLARVRLADGAADGIYSARARAAAAINGEPINGISLRPDTRVASQQNEGKCQKRPSLHKRRCQL